MEFGDEPDIWRNFRLFRISWWRSHRNPAPPSRCKIQLKLSHQDFIRVRLPKFREKRYGRKEASFGRSKSFWRFLRSPNGCSVDMRSIWHRNSGWKPPLRLARFNSVGGSPFSGSTFYELNLSARLSAVCKIQSLCGPPLAVRARGVDRSTYPVFLPTPPGCKVRAARVQPPRFNSGPKTAILLNFNWFPSCFWQGWYQCNVTQSARSSRLRGVGWWTGYLVKVQNALLPMIKSKIFKYQFARFNYPNNNLQFVLIQIHKRITNYNWIFLNDYYELYDK